MKIHPATRFTHPTCLLTTVGAALLMLLAEPSMADPGESGFTTIERTATSSNLGDRVFIRISTTPTAVTTCHEDSTWHFVLDTSNDWGKRAYAMLLEARAMGRQVWLSGTDGVCLNGVQAVRSITTYN